MNGLIENIYLTYEGWGPAHLIFIDFITVLIHLQKPFSWHAKRIILFLINLISNLFNI